MELIAALVIAAVVAKTGRDFKDACPPATTITEPSMTVAALEALLKTVSTITGQDMLCRTLHMFPPSEEEQTQMQEPKWEGICNYNKCDPDGAATKDDSTEATTAKRRPVEVTEELVQKLEEKMNGLNN